MQVFSSIILYAICFKSLAATSRLLHRTIDYSYDKLSRILSANYDSGDRIHDYSFDVSGNRLEEAISGTGVTAVTTEYEYNTANQINRMRVDAGSWTNFTFDDNGNLTNDGTNSYTWDRANRMLTLNDGSDTYSYTYDGNSRRISQSVNSIVTEYLLDNQPALSKVIAQTTGMNTDRFVHAPRGIHAMEDNAGNWIYAAQDALGSVRAAFDDTATIQQRVNYNPVGVPDSSYDGFAFTGEQRDSNGLQYHRARYYDPALGVWASLDPLETANRYGYVGGNFVMNVDPLGLFDWATGTVEKGDHLFCIAREGTGGWQGNTPPSFYAVERTYRRVLEYNNIPERPVPDRIYPGQKLNLPGNIRRVGLRNANKSCHPDRVVNFNLPGIPCLPDTIAPPPVSNIPDCPSGYQSAQRVYFDIVDGEVIEGESEFYCECVSAPECSPGSIYSAGDYNNCKIEIAGYETSMDGAYHAFLIFTDKFGQEWEYRGGPSSQGFDIPLGLTHIVTSKLRFNETGNDYNLYLRSSSRLPRIPLLSGALACSAQSCFDRTIEDIASKKYQYWLHQNSNSVARTLLNSCGIMGGINQYGVEFPGWETVLE